MADPLTSVSPREALFPATPRQRLIVALDVPELDEARRVVHHLAPAVRWFKVGSELYTAAGPAAVGVALDAGARVFLDLKFHDIPHTVRGAVASALRLGVSMLNVHALGGEEMMRAAGEARASAPLFVIGVTALTSAAEDAGRVVELARRAQHAGLDGVVASPREAARIKEACGPRFVVVTPGIRLSPVPSDDQRRTAAPGPAVRAGSDFLVVGRPILRAGDPLGVIEQIVAEMEQAHAVPGA